MAAHSMPCWAWLYTSHASPAGSCSYCPAVHIFIAAVFCTFWGCWNPSPINNWSLALSLGVINLETNQGTNGWVFIGSVKPEIIYKTLYVTVYNFLVKGTGIIEAVHGPQKAKTHSLEQSVLLHLETSRFDQSSSHNWDTLSHFNSSSVSSCKNSSRPYGSNSIRIRNLEFV